MQLSPAQVLEFQQKILTWYKINQRDLPWRKTRNPYHILVSEVMLQQTQVARVIPKYAAWMKKFPTVEALAKASTADVLQYWSGLGYNRRALNLKKTAQIVSETYGGTFPSTEKELVTLPGIGTYTARAVLCFAFDKQVAVVDTNVRKVIVTQIMHLSAQNILYSEKELEALARELLPANKAYEWNQALMDYSSTVLKKEKITVPKQSTFKGSHRYYRGQVLKVLLEKKALNSSDLAKIIKSDFTPKDTAWFEKLLEELIHEGFIIKKKNVISLSS